MSLDLAAVIAGSGAQVVRVEPDGSRNHGGLSRADLQIPISGVTIDSRDVSAGNLFVALRGERTDGHHFAAHAVAAGARVLLVERLPETLTNPSGQTVYACVVPDSLEALHSLARYWRRRLNPRVVGITGSVGKTTTKEITASVLDRRFRVLRTHANLNTEVGLPLMLLRLTPEHRVAVLEMGMYVPGDIAVLSRIAEPDIGVVTNVAPVHLERAGSIERIARGKSELVQALDERGVAILNGDDMWTRAMARSATIAPTRLVGLSKGCDIRAEEVRSRGIEGISFVLHAEGRRFAVETRVAGVHMVHAFLFAVGVARALDMPWDDILPALEAVTFDTRQRISMVGDLVVIDDAYNASPLSVTAALKMLGSTPGERVAVLGDMLELGADEREAHLEIGRIAASEADRVVALGPRARWIAEGAIEAGMGASRVWTVDTTEEIVRLLRESVLREPVTTGPTRSPTMQRPATPRTILIKGSRGMHMEDVVAALRGES